MKRQVKRYSKIDLQAAKENMDTAIVSEVVSRLLKGDKMSMAEIEFACSVLRASKAEGETTFTDLAPIPLAQDYLFRTLYIHYHADLEGRYGIEKFTGLVPIEEKKADVIRLNEYYLQWEKVIATNRHKENILNLVINETNPDLKHISALYKSGDIDKSEYDYKRKSIVLHSKYLYLNAKAFFDEHQSDTVTVSFHGKQMEINEHSLVHILKRHYAGAAKQFDTGKSFHMDQELKWYEIPYELKRILELIGSDHRTKHNGIKFIPFQYQGVKYAVWTERQKKHIKGSAIPFVRLETFYPVEEKKDIDKIQNDYHEVRISDKLVAYAEN